MKAILLFRRKFSIKTADDRQIIFFMDLYKLPTIEKNEFDPPFRFSWIAFDSEDAAKRVLIDCHKPKGPHVHIDNDAIGTPFPWKGIDHAQKLFFKLVARHFGALQE